MAWGRWRIGSCCGCAPPGGVCELFDGNCNCVLEPVDYVLSTPDGDVDMRFVDSADFRGWWGVLSHEATFWFFNPTDDPDYHGEDPDWYSCVSHGEINVLFIMSCPDDADYPLIVYRAQDFGTPCVVSRGVLRWTGAAGASRPYLGVPWDPTGDYGWQHPAYTLGDEVCSCDPFSVEFKIVAAWRPDEEEVTVTITK